ncbi:MAG: DUF4424 domain-containing protein [Caulobacter sp.]|nr:DUF4424 domain-containing protein [Caulobacter sp.]
MKRALLALTLTAALAGPALANDSSAELAAGGLVLTRSEAIEMRSEDLYISADEIRVRYVFINTSGADVTTRVAFPLPDLGGPSFAYEPNGIPDSESPTNPLGFATLVDGKPAAMAVDQRAFVGEVDRTAWLTANGIPLALYLDSVAPALDALPQARQDEAVALGLAIVDEYDAGQGWERHLAPAWTLRAAFHWEQTFPAGREVVVEHHYRPVVGYSAGTLFGVPGFETDETWPATQARYCIDKAFLAGAARRANPEGYALLTEERIAYILKTGGNWAKPIGDFRMVIDKGSADSLVSFCASGVSKIGPTLFEVRKTNWTPDHDLDVLILKPLPEEE